MVVGHFQASWRPEEYLANNKMQWTHLHSRLRPMMSPPAAESKPSDLEYPFENALQVLADEAPHLLRQQETRPSSAGAAKAVSLPRSGGPSAAEAAVNVPFSSLAQTLIVMAPEDRQRHLEALVLDTVRELNGDTDIGVSAPLMDAGFDSLSAVDLASRLAELVGFELSPTLVFEQPSMQSVAAYLLEQLVLEGAAAPHNSGTPPLAGGDEGSSCNGAIGMDAGQLRLFEVAMELRKERNRDEHAADGAWVQSQAVAC